MDIHPLSLRDLDRICAIARSCGKHMQSQGIFQWHESYPAPSDFEKDLQEKRIWGGWENDLLIGFVVYTTQMSPAYEEVPWNCPDTPNAYVHRLAVDPPYQRQGKAGLLMDFCESKARAEGCTSVRLDAYSRNPINLGFYEQRGYSRCGEVFYPHKNPHPFYCFEKQF